MFIQTVSSGLSTPEHPVFLDLSCMPSSRNLQSLHVGWVSHRGDGSQHGRTTLCCSLHSGTGSGLPQGGSNTLGNGQVLKKGRGDP